MVTDLESKSISHKLLTIHRLNGAFHN